MSRDELKKKKNQIKVFVACISGYEFTEVLGVALDMAGAKELYADFRRYPGMGENAVILEAPLGSKIANPLYGSRDTESKNGYKWHNVTF